MAECCASVCIDCLAAALRNDGKPHIFNLDSSVGRARVGRWRHVWVGAATQWAPAHKEKQRPQVRCQWLNRVRSAVTHRVILVEAEIFKLHRHLLIN